MDWEQNKMGDCFTMKEWISGFSLWHILLGAWCWLPIVVNDIVCACAGVFLFSRHRENDRTYFRTNKSLRGACSSKAFEMSSLRFHRTVGGLTSRQVGWRQAETNTQTERQTGSPYSGRQSPQTASEVAVPGVATLRPRILQEACGRQSSESKASEKLPVGHNWHCTSSVGLWICPQAWQERKHF